MTERVCRVQQGGALYGAPPSGATGRSTYQLSFKSGGFIPCRSRLGDARQGIAHPLKVLVTGRPGAPEVAPNLPVRLSSVTSFPH
jgi:hypothetical protein